MTPLSFTFFSDFKISFPFLKGSIPFQEGEGNLVFSMRIRWAGYSQFPCTSCHPSHFFIAFTLFWNVLLFLAFNLISSPASLCTFLHWFGDFNVNNFNKFLLFPTTHFITVNILPDNALQKILPFQIALDLVINASLSVCSTIFSDSKISFPFLKGKISYQEKELHLVMRISWARFPSLPCTSHHLSHFYKFSLSFRTYPFSISFLQFLLLSL